MSPMKLAVLLCDTPLPEVVATYGDYASIFHRLLSSSSYAPPFTLDPYDVVSANSYPEDPTSYDAILLTGSKHSAHGDDAWIHKLVDFVRTTASSHPQVKLIGICFGHQIIARALGGDQACVVNKAGWEQMHRDHVPSLPPGFHLLASTPIAPVQGMVKFKDGKEDDVHIFAVQGHPEFTEPIVSIVVKTRGANGILSKEIVEDATKRKDIPTDGALVADSIWRILQPST
ncbi:class I glutamine amidotransferase-like protein [Desarmillaria tabescens]|uniref:Class I glutamine amidotransferase-like protein n=1 Tax=Armillaria tabescens TaxID=1929756 RepID=A0AA39KH83_ARMTA|nr:class I glutamine amidotransferase-like protein [Desarmillaria tabescens]KAK0459975.1 class I glutamine amidotransferase-like protein [Desarmillaria tabescens]